MTSPQKINTWTNSYTKHMPYVEINMCMIVKLKRNRSTKITFWMERTVVKSKKYMHGGQRIGLVRQLKGVDWGLSVSRIKRMVW
jgi:hypothetical protein